MENILFISGGIWQRPFVKYLKDKGNSIIIVNPVSNETTSLADHHIKTDVNNVEEIYSRAKSMAPTIVTSDQSDISVHIVAQLAKRLGLRGNSPETIRRFSDKWSIYEFAKKIGVSVPHSRIVNSADEIIEFGTTHGFPIIIKPVDATMSRGFLKFDQADEITQEKFLSSQTFSKSKRVIAQEFIPGEMIVLDGVCSNNRHKVLSTSQKVGYFKPGITKGLKYPAQTPVLEQIIEINDKYVELAGLDYGLTHSEYIVAPDGIYLIEIGARGGGAGITNKIVPWVSGINTYDVIYECLLNGVVDVNSLAPLKKPAFLKYYSESEVTNCNNDKAKTISAIPGVAEFQFNFIGKQYTKDVLDSRHTMGIYLAESEEQLDAILAEVDRIIS